MKTQEQSYIEYICSNCRNKHTDLCEIRTRYDNTMYCSSYDAIIRRKKKTPVNWQEW